MIIKLKPTSVIKAELGLSPNGETRKFFTKRCAEYMDKYVPMRQGNLRRYHILGENIIYNQPYARYQYYGKLMVMSNGKGAYYNPKTQRFWSKKGEKKILTDRDLVYNTEQHKDACAKWDKKMWSVYKEQIIKETKAYMRRK